MCAKEELRQDRSCSSGVSLLCFFPFGSPVSGAGVVLCLLQISEGEESTWLECEAEHTAPSSLFTQCATRNIMECSGFTLCLRRLRGAALQPFLTEALCCCAGIMYSGFPGHSFKLWVFASQSACLRHPTASLWVCCCKCIHRISANAFFFYFSQDQLDVSVV